MLNDSASTSNPLAGSFAPLNIALVGFGYWGTNLARNVHASTVANLVAIVDLDPERRSKASALYPDVAVIGSVDELLATDDVEAVAIATPAASHAAIATACLRAGRHVLVEKPLASSASEANALVTLADELGLTCAVGHTFLYSAPVRYLRERLVAGDLGAVQYIYSQRLNLGRVRQDCNALWNFAPHDISIILYLLDALPSEVSGRGASFLQPGIDDVCFATLSFPSGVTANLHVSWLDPRKTRLMTVVGDKKMAVFDDVSADQKISIYDAGVSQEPVTQAEFSSMGDFQWRTRAGNIEIPQIQLREPLLTEIDEFAAACRLGSPTPGDARSGRNVVRVLEAISESCDRGGCAVGIAW